LATVTLSLYYYYLPKSQINHRQQIQNCLAVARSVVKAP